MRNWKMWTHLKIILTNLLHGNINSNFYEKESYFPKTKKWHWEWHCFTCLQISLMSGLIEDKQDSHICICIQSVVMPCFYQSTWRKSCLTKVHSWKRDDLSKGLGDPGSHLENCCSRLQRQQGVQEINRRACDQRQTSHILGDKVKAQLKPKSFWDYCLTTWSFLILILCSPPLFILYSD